MEQKEYLRRSKWNKWCRVDLDAKLRNCQPFTRPYSIAWLKDFLEKYEKVFIKPDNSFGGRNVICVYYDNGFPNRLIVMNANEQYSFATLEEFDQWFSTFKKKRFFLIQQGVKLCSLEERPVDIRTILQLNEQKMWEVTGIFVKVAKPGSVVTNVKAGGTIRSLDDYLQCIALNDSTIEDELKRLSIEIAEVFHKCYQNTLYGLDIGLDGDGKLWLIEINTKPLLHVLKSVSTEMYKRSMQLRELNKEPLDIE